jgi:endo-1,4-beta-D-glucanase Y
MSILEFLNIYGPHMYPNLEMVTFMVRGKNQFIELRSTYSNNKYWVEQFFYIFENWKAADSEALFFGNGAFPERAVRIHCH